jgi:hypothetical protein
MKKKVIEKGKDFYYGLGAFLTVGLMNTPLFAGDSGAGETAYCTILDKMDKYVPPVIKIGGLVIVLLAIIGAFVSFFRREVGWAIGILIVGILVGMGLYALSPVAENTISDIMSNVGCK